MSSYKFCFLFGPGRCGLKLLLSLFDNHEQVLALPFTMKLYYYFNDETIKVNYEDLIKIIEEKTRFRLLKEKTKDIRLSIGNDDHSLYDHSIFCRELKKLISNRKVFKRREIIENIYLSYALAIKKDLKKIKYIIVDATYHDYLDKINFDFKDYKSIFLLRDPREQLLSFLKLHHRINKSLYIKNYTNYLTHSIFSQKENYFLLERLQDENYNNFTIKFENLKKKPKAVMEKIAEFLKINFTEELTKTTTFGQLRKFDTSFSKNPIVGLGEDNTNRIEIYFNKYQIIQTEFIFSYHLNKFKYLPISSYKKNFLTKLIIYFQPFKFEILPSIDILKKNNSEAIKYKNNYFFKLLKFLYYLSYNIFCYFTNRFINFSYLKLFNNIK